MDYSIKDYHKNNYIVSWRYPNIDKKHYKNKK
jgi:hypothetical protein